MGNYTFKEYQELLKYIFSRYKSYQIIGNKAYKPGLENAIELDKYFGSPHKSYKTIHIAGTNGKGSVSHLLASVLQEAGYITGLYTSPHLFDFRERIKVNGIMISEEEVTEFFNHHYGFFEENDFSFFEMTSSLAFQYFKERNVDIAVIETGLGGRLDSTNIINPVVSVITNIGLDHTDLLGDTKEKIAFEKAGIIKRNVPVVIGEPDEITFPVFEKVCADNYIEPVVASREYILRKSFISANEYRQYSILRNGKEVFPGLKTGLAGIYQEKNVLTALASIDILKEKGFDISENNIYRGFRDVVKSTGIKGRWQVVSKNPLIICDVGHNNEGITENIRQLKDYKYNNLHVVIGIVSGKNIDTSLKLFPENTRFYFTKADVERAMDENILMKRAGELNIKGKVYPDVATALKTAYLDAETGDLIFIGGSTFVVADALKQIHTILK